MGYIIVLDPGHGGTQDGGNINGLFEKKLTLSVAKAMKQYLEKFDGVTVYLTRSDDSELTIQERLDFAHSVDADYFISLHFNMSSLHNLYGSEIWLPIQSSYYNKLYPFADQVVSYFEEMGFHNRGIKTRVGKGGDNYYGVIRIGTNYGIPSCIIEHCFLDNENDAFAVPKQPEALNASLADFGTRDGLALAKALHLKSTSLGLDFSSYPLNTKKVKNNVIPDETEPEINEISLVSADLANGKVTINMHAVDKQSFIQYYMYSTNGGLTYSTLKDYPRTSWNSSVDNVVLTLDVPKNQPVNLVTCIMNQYDKLTISNILTVEESTVATPVANSVGSDDVTLDVATESKTEYHTINYEIGKEVPSAGIVDSVGFKISVFATASVLGLLVLLFATNKIRRNHKKKR